MAMTKDELLALIDQAAAEGWTELDLSGQGLSELPEEIGKLTQLERLILGKGKKDKDGKQQWRFEFIDGKHRSVALTIGNKLTALPACLKQLSELRHLDISGNPISLIPENISELSQLKTFIALKSKLTQIPDSIAQLASLQQLYLSSNQITEIPDSIAQLASLQQLDLSSNQITEIPDSIAQLASLQQLDLRYNQITEIPDSIAQLASLQQLDLSSNQITEIPDSIAQLASLQQLDLRDNQITEIPDSIAQLASLQQLDLSSNQITEIPDSIAQLASLQQLDLSSNQITEIPDSIAQLASLQQLDLSSNQITEIPDSIAQLASLQQLYLSSNQITEIPDSIAQLASLQQLDLSSNQITEIPDSIAQLASLQQLDLSSNQITEIPDSIAQLASLQQLYLRDNQITEIPDSIAQLASLQQLDLRDNQITEIPDSIAQLASLQQLYLSSNQITEIPDSIAQLASLQQLYLSSNQITEIPDSIAQLASLQQLYLSSNQITEIPDSIAQLASLQQLDLRDNQITEIPDSIAQLASLQQLDLSYNQITEIPDSIAQLASLQQLYLSYNQITEIPDSIAQLASLQQLYLSYNQITEIPDSIAQLASLQQLDLRDNQITEIPDSIAQLASLQQLDLRDNQITEIPDSIAQLASLQQLDLRYNQITEIPGSLESLEQLQRLDVRHNPLPIAPEILGPPEDYEEPGPVSGIFNYCRQLRSGDVRPLNEAKLILVGQGSVGKTSLINRLIEDSFNPNESQTDGLNVSNWQINVNTKDVRLNVWDFGGQEIYHATHQFFLTKRSLYLLVCNCRTSEEENRLDYWLKLIKSFGDKAPVIIVGNKRDEQPLDINRKALRDKYPNIQAIIETSCSDGTGIDKLNQAIRKEVGLLKEVYDLLPLSWFQVKEHLENLDKDFIKYSKYESICDQQGIEAEKDQTQLIKLLHNLGLVLNYSDHPLLKHTNVLNPDWVTTGIYTLLSDDDLKTEANGQLTPTDLTRILPDDRYPEQRHHYLIELMKEFQLCFQLPECSPDRYLIPGILPKEEPEDTDLEGETLEFQYHYTVLPDSVISRFIVLMHDKIHKQTYWRSGVMLAYTEGNEVYNIARIKADPADNKIFIAISGKESTRRLFLGLIRDVFKKIHANFAKPTEWVPVPDHPDHPPLDYQELLGLEDMGEQNKVIGKLKLKLNLRQLLDGYEPIEIRRLKQKGVDIDSTGDGINISVTDARTKIIQQGDGDNVAGDLIEGNKTIT